MLQKDWTPHAHGQVNRLPQNQLEQTHTSRTALRLPDDLSLDSWTGLGNQLLTISDSSAWWIGDWLAFGQKRYSDRYRRAMRDTSLHYQTLRNYAWIARRFEPSRRRDKLTFQHHVEVAALPPRVQDHWLELAEKFGWSRNELRRQIRNSEAPPENDADSSGLRVSLRPKRDQVDRWEEAARRSNRSLVDWIASALDNATMALDTR